MRLDLALVAQGFANSRNQAARLIKAGQVSVNGKTIERASWPVADTDQIDCAGQEWVSRAAYKLLGALAASGVQVPARVLDAGASTGGFTQVCLAKGAKQVYAIDVGHDQLAPVLRADSRVIVREGLNLRDLTLADLDNQPVDLVVGDISFISLKLLLAPLFSVLNPTGQALLMVKPQFEVGREKLGAGGLVKNRADRQQAIDSVIAKVHELGWQLAWQADAELAGQQGNLEYFILCQRPATEPTGQPGGPATKQPTLQ